MKNVLICGAKMDKTKVYGCHCADLWWDSRTTTKKAVYAHKDGYLKRIIYINELFSTTPSFTNKELTFKFPKQFNLGKKHSKVPVDPIIMELLTPIAWNEDINYEFSEPHDLGEKHPEVYVKPITMAIEMPIEEVKDVPTVHDFVKNTLIFWDIFGEKKFLADKLVEVWVDKRVHSITLTAGELLEKYGNRKIFCFLHCHNSFRVEKPNKHIVLF